MLFEEFFKKKKINLTALHQGDPAIFSEFKEHYEQMGEKSFDHTKKYWFNKLRRLYPLPPEVKAEKPHMENQVAEQTVADTLTEPTPRDKAPDLGFKPKFKAGTTAQLKPAEETPAENTLAVPPSDQQPEQTLPAAEATATPATPAPRLGFKPKFKTVPAKPATEPLAEATPSEIPSDIPSANPPEETEKLEAEVSATPKPAYKPRFQAKNIPPKLAAEPTGTPEAETTAPAPDALAAESHKETSEVPATPPAEATPAPKIGFKPRFKASAPPKNIEKPKAEEEPAPIPQPQVQEDPMQEPDTSSDTVPGTPASETPAPKPVYKPRFNPKMIKSKPPEEGGTE